MNKKLSFKIYLQPGAKKSEIVGQHADCIKIKVQSPPVDGKANEALIDFISEAAGIPKSTISISAGLKSRFKTVCIKNCDQQTEARIQELFSIRKIALKSRSFCDNI